MTAGNGNAPEVIRALESIVGTVEAVLVADAQAAIESRLAELRASGIQIHATVRVEVTGIGQAPGERRAPRPSGRKSRKVREAILAVVKDGVSKPADIHKALEARGVQVSASAVHQRLSKMVKAGEVARVEGVYAQSESQS